MLGKLLFSGDNKGVPFSPLPTHALGFLPWNPYQIHIMPIFENRCVRVFVRVSECEREIREKRRKGTFALCLM